MRYLSLFSGIEAATVAWEPLGWEPVAFAEVEKFPSAVLAHHYPHVLKLGDVTKHKEWPDLGPVDLVCGGSPCQSFSVAGLRKGLDDPRGNLMLTFGAIAARYRPRWLVWENVPGVLSSNKGRDFGTFLGMLGQLGYGFAYRVLDAQYFGLAQRRKRVFVVGCLGDWRAAAAVLFERHSLSGHPAPRREAGQRPAPTLAARPSGGGGLGTGFDLDGGLVHAPEIARCVATREGSSQDYETTTMLAVSVTGDVAHTLKAEGADASEDGTGRGTPIVAFGISRDALDRSGEGSGGTAGERSGLGIEKEVSQTLKAKAPNAVAICFSAKDSGADASYDVSPTLRAGGHSGSHANAGVMPAITVAIRGREGGATAELGGEVATALRASQGGGDKPHVLAFHENQRAEITLNETAGALGVGGGKPGQGYPAAFMGSAVRRLTPVECERLMGFPDGYTAIPWRGKPASECPDGPRYKALGNSMAVNVMRWIGMRIQMVEEIVREAA